MGCRCAGPPWTHSGTQTRPKLPHLSYSCQIEVIIAQSRGRSSSPAARAWSAKRSTAASLRAPLDGPDNANPPLTVAVPGRAQRDGEAPLRPHRRADVRAARREQRDRLAARPPQARPRRRARHRGRVLLEGNRYRLNLRAHRPRNAHRPVRPRRPERGLSPRPHDATIGTGGDGKPDAKQSSARSATNLATPSFSQVRAGQIVQDVDPARRSRG